MDDKSTMELNQLLERMNTDNLTDYLDDNFESLLTGDRDFTNFMKSTIRKHKRFQKDVFIAAGFSQSYGGQLLDMSKHTVNRDAIIKLCLGGHFTVEETKKALTLYGMSALYARDPRDAIMMVAINNRVFEICDVDELLEREGQQTLRGSEE